MNPEKPDYEIAAEELAALYASLGISAVSSEPKGEVHEGMPMIAYSVSFTKGSSTVSFNYSMGIGHVKWRLMDRWPLRIEGVPDLTVDRIAEGMVQHKKIKPEYAEATAKIAAAFAKKQHVAPRPQEVLASVCRETLGAEVTFEEWASEYGYDLDSRKAEKIYRLCQDNGAKARKLVTRLEMERLAELASRL